MSPRSKECSLCGVHLDFTNKPPSRTGVLKDGYELCSNCLKKTMVVFQVISVGTLSFSDVVKRVDPKQPLSEVTPALDLSDGSTFDEKKKRIRDVFVTVEDDKFTKLRKFQGKEAIEFPATESLPEMNLSLAYVHGAESDMCVMTLWYVAIGDRFHGMDEAEIYFLLDDQHSIELKSVSFDRERSGDQANILTERMIFHCPISNLIQMVNAKKLEYSIRMGGKEMEGVLDGRRLWLLKGFYNNALDEDFEVDFLYQGLKAQQPTAQKGGGCFVATAVYGSQSHPQVLALREWRDDVLLRSAFGRLFVAVYYSVSPGVARWLEGHEKLSGTIRVCLDRLAGIVSTR